LLRRAETETNCRVRKIFHFLAATMVAALVLASPCAAADSAAHPAPPVAELSAVDAIVLGVVEGVTEFLPISSTGHLIIASHVLGLDAERQLTDAGGHPLWVKAPAAERKEGKLTALKRWVYGAIGREYKVDHPEGIPLTVARAANTYNVVIQFGAIAAVALLYWPQLRSIVLGFLGRDVAGLHLGVNLIVAFIPAAAIGYLIHDWIDDHFAVGAVILAQALGAFLMLFAESWRRRHFRVPSTDDNLSQLGLHHAAGIGALQVLALWPGMSRSMTTIVGGYFAGLDPRRSAEFSFLLGFLTLTAATVFKSLQGGAGMIQVFGWSHVLLGCIVAAGVAALCVRWLVGWLSRHGLAAFAYYRLAVAAALAIFFYR
jgi:undecaprenyl-diphosphatase